MRPKAMLKDPKIIADRSKFPDLFLSTPISKPLRALPKVFGIKWFLMTLKCSIVGIKGTEIRVRRKGCLKSWRELIDGSLFKCPSIHDVRLGK